MARCQNRAISLSGETWPAHGRVARRGHLATYRRRGSANWRNRPLRKERVVVDNARTTALRLRDEVRRWLHERGPIDDHAVFLSLTFTSQGRGVESSQHTAERDIRHFLRLLQRKTSGNAQDRHHRRLRVISVREQSRIKRLHYHLILEVPSNKTRTQFIALCKATWSQLRRAGYASVKRCRDAGALSYMLKDRDKSDFTDAIDVMNTYL